MVMRRLTLDGRGRGKAVGALVVVLPRCMIAVVPMLHHQSLIFPVRTGLRTSALMESYPALLLGLTGQDIEKAAKARLFSLGLMVRLLVGMFL
jgi:hypothetical protein